MKIGAIIEARMGSSRLPGKIMLPLGGVPALGRLVERLRHCPELDEIIVATTTTPSDLVIAEFAKEIGAKFYRGSETDVLERVYLAAKNHDLDVIVEVTSDCPLADPKLISRGIQIFKDGGYDYVANTLERTFPIGMDIQVFKTKCLEEIHLHSNDPVHREHVSIGIYENPQKYKLQNYADPNGFNLSQRRLTLDTSNDYLVIKHIFETLYPQNSVFSYEDMAEYMTKNPDIFKTNENIKQKEARPSEV